MSSECTASRVCIVPSFHHDVAYLKRESEYLERVLAIIDDAMDLLDAHEEYRFTVEQVYAMMDYWQHRPHRRASVVRHAASGRLAVDPGMYVMIDMNLPDGESLFQQVRIGTAWLEEHLGIRPRVSWMADCWGHHAQLPQILTQCGYDYYMFWRCMRRDTPVTDFLWQGLDGTTLRTHWLHGSYSGIRFGDADMLNREEQADGGASQQAIMQYCQSAARYGAKDVVVLSNSGDFLHPQAAAIPTVAALNNQGDMPDLIFATAGAALDAIDWTSVPTLGGEFNSAFQGTYTSNITIKQRNRQLVYRLLAIEALAVIMDTRTVDLEQAWQLTLKQQFHDIICGTICDGALADAHADMDRAEALLDEATKSLCDNSASCVPAVCNPTAWPRTELIEHNGRRHLVSVPGMGCAAVTDDTVVQESTPGELPVTFEGDGYRATINTEGYIERLELTTGSDTSGTASGPQMVADGPAPFGSLAMQLDYGDLWLNLQGPLGGDFKEHALVQNHGDPYRRDNTGSMVQLGTFQPTVSGAKILSRSSCHLQIEQIATIQYWQLRVEYTTVMTLRSDSPVIAYETTLTCHGKNARIRVVFPTTIGCETTSNDIEGTAGGSATPQSEPPAHAGPKASEGHADTGRTGANAFSCASALESDGQQPAESGRTIRYEIPYGIQQRCPSEHAAQNWLDLQDDNAGLTLINTGTPGCSVDGGILMNTLFRSVAMEYKTSSTDSYHVGQPHTFRYAIMCHPTGADAHIVRRATECNRPLVGLLVSEHILQQSDTWRVEPDNIIISAVRHRGGQVFVRLYEATGQATDARIQVPRRFSAYCMADGLERPTSQHGWTMPRGPSVRLPGFTAAGSTDLQQCGYTAEYRDITDDIQLSLRPFEIVSLLLRPCQTC